MSVWSIDDLVKGTGGQLLQRGEKPLEGVATDTRGQLKDKVFFALKGDRYDAHEFVGQAASLGAAAVIISRDVPKLPADLTVIKVNDTLKALQNFGNWHRKRWTGKLVALTGSNGKTTTKEFCATILSQKFPCLATQGNLNNHIGVPLTLLELRNTHKLGVIELGMNHSGEITELCKISEPDIVMVTNVGSAHIEFFETVENIARAKEEIYEAAPDKATRIYNLDNQYTAMMRARAPGTGRVLAFSSYDKKVDVSLKEKLYTLEYLEVQGVIGGEPGHVKIPVYGRHHVATAMAASSVALACGIDAPLIWKGLQNCRATWGRGQVVELETGAKIIFDAYNANPESSAMAMENFAKITARGRKFIVCGDMLELGELSAKAHYELGVKIGQALPDGVLLIGQYSDEMAAGIRSTGITKNIVISKDYQEKLAAGFGAVLQKGDMVLMKASRGMKLERVLELWNPVSFGQGSGNKH